MRNLIIIPLLALTACGKSSSDNSNAQSVADAFEVHSHCQLQSVAPAPNYGPDVKLKTYLCSQFSPSCFVVLLSSPAYDQVPSIVSNNCPSNGQVPL